VYIVLSHLIFFLSHPHMQNTNFMFVDLEKMLFFVVFVVVVVIVICMEVSSLNKTAFSGNFHKTCHCLR